MSAGEDYVPFTDDLPSAPPEVEALQDLAHAVRDQTDRVENELALIREQMELRGRYGGGGLAVFVAGLLAFLAGLFVAGGF